ncbi:histidine kinase N-terminal 7TM domain-containing protein [Haloglomus litoreum]|uniref:sensor histidine kinase n=1 Tax=Haloglomus litoreum TaxID=3034026 RepID=UPI0023E84A00|nr:histidine kinase N-terminal 7TM domain-containing protein [Haloglomus sp. DT116]
MVDSTAASVSLLYAVATALPALLLGYALRTRRDSPTARAFAATMGGLICWSGAYLLRLFVDGTAQFALTVAAFVGVAGVPVALLTFTLRYTDRERYVTANTVALLSVLPATTVLVLATNPLHGLFYRSMGAAAVGSLSTITAEAGPWFWVHTAYSYGLLAVASALLVAFGVSRRRLYRAQAAGLILGVFVAWATNAAFLVGLTPFPDIDLTPVGLAAGVTCLGVAVFRARLVDVTPIARNAVVEALDDGVVVIEGGRIVDANPAARAILRVEAPVGEAAAAALPGPVVDAARRGVQTADGGEGVVDIVQDGKRRWYRVRAIPLDRGGVAGSDRAQVPLSTAIDAGREGPPATVLLLTDVTARRHHLRRLRKQNEQLEEFAAAAAHDLRNPLNVIDGYTELARESGDPAHFDRIEQASDRMSRLVEDLLALGRRGRLVESTSAVSLPEVAERAWQSIESQDATLAVSASDTVPADADRLVQLLENLFANAVQQDPGVTVTVGRMPDGFYVADDGPGIPQDEREQVFDYGYTTRETGSGFGLSIVETVADAHGWEVQVTESEDGGARFEITGVTGFDDVPEPVSAD